MCMKNHTTKRGKEEVSTIRTKRIYQTKEHTKMFMI